LWRATRRFNIAIATSAAVATNAGVRRWLHIQEDTERVPMTASGQTSKAQNEQMFSGFLPKRTSDLRINK
jgi:hypothetical protein